MKLIKDRFCRKCDSCVTRDREEVTKGYSYYCPNCDEDLFKFETIKMKDTIDYFELIDTNDNESLLIFGVKSMKSEEMEKMIQDYISTDEDGFNVDDCIDYLDRELAKLGKKMIYIPETHKINF